MKPHKVLFHWSPTGAILEAYVPGTLRDWNLGLPSDVRDSVDTAAAALRSASETMGVGHQAVPFWSESLGSSHIEGVRPSTHNVLHTIALNRSGATGPVDSDVAEVLNNITSYTEALSLAGNGWPIAGVIAEAHACLMEGDPVGDGGRIRTVQNWVGKDDGPETADYIPPPPDRCSELLDDLCWYIENTVHHPVVAAAIAHAQFELIHPFRDGNGRVGRVIMNSILRGVLPNKEAALAPVSLALSRDPGAYFDALSAMVEHGPDPDDAARSNAASAIVETVCRAATRASRAVESYTETADSIKSQWKTMTAEYGNPCIDHALDYLVSHPSMTLHDLRSLSGATKRKCNDAFRTLSDLHIVVPRRTSGNLTVYDADIIVGAYEIMSDTICEPATVAGRRYDALLKDEMRGVHRLPGV